MAKPTSDMVHEMDEWCRTCEDEGLRQLRRLCRHGNPRIRRARAASPFRPGADSDREDVRFPDILRTQTSFRMSSIYDL